MVLDFRGISLSRPKPSFPPGKRQAFAWRLLGAQVFSRPVHLDSTRLSPGEKPGFCLVKTWCVGPWPVVLDCFPPGKAQAFALGFPGDPAHTLAYARFLPGVLHGGNLVFGRGPRKTIECIVISKCEAIWTPGKRLAYAWGFPGHKETPRHMPGVFLVSGSEIPTGIYEIPGIPLDFRRITFIYDMQYIYKNHLPPGEKLVPRHSPGKSLVSRFVPGKNLVPRFLPWCLPGEQAPAKAAGINPKDSFPPGKRLGDCQANACTFPGYQLFTMAVSLVNAW